MKTNINQTDELVNASEAAKRLGVSSRTAIRRANEAWVRNDPQLRHVGQAWIAPMAWWEQALRLRPSGRPRNERTTPPSPSE